MWLCQSLLVDLSVIGRVNVVRKNVDATIRLLDKFRSLPEQCEELLDEMYERDRHIKKVYLQLRKLMLLRDTAFDPTIAASFSEDFTEKLTDTFSHLTDTADELELRLFENIGDWYEQPTCTHTRRQTCSTQLRSSPDCWPALLHWLSTLLAKEDPTTLIRTLEVIEMEDRALSRKVFAQSTPPVAMKDRLLSTLETSIANAFADLHKDEAQAAREKRKKALAAEKEKKHAAKQQVKAQKQQERKERGEDAEGDDDDELLDADDEEAVEAADESQEDGVVSNSDLVSDYACEVLEEMQVLVEQLDDIKADLGRCFPPSYHIVDFYELRYRRWIKVTINFHTNDVRKLSKKALLKSCSWMTWYIDRMRELRYSTQEDEDEWVALMAEMITAFCQATESTITQLIDNILRAEEQAEPELNESGHYHTTGPADLFYTINQQMDIVLNAYGLKSHALANVVLMLADVFTYYQDQQLEFLGEVELDDNRLLFGPNQIEKSDTYFCAVINNVSRQPSSKRALCPVERCTDCHRHLSAVCVQCELCRENMDELKDRCVDKIRAEQGIPSPALTSAVNIPAASPSTSSFSAKHLPTVSLSQLTHDIEDAFDDCGEGFISVASEAVDILVLQIITTLQEPIAALFTTTWLREPATSADITSTLQDFFDDYGKVGHALAPAPVSCMSDVWMSVCL